MVGSLFSGIDGMTRTQALRAAGNAVCPQQAMLALDLLGMPCAYSATGSGSRHNQPEEAT